MKLSFTEKLILDDVQKIEKGLVVKLKSYLKEDFIERALTINITSKGVVEGLYFSSNDFGTAKWSNGNGLYDAHRWETEDDLMSISTLARRYPTILEDGPVAGDFALIKIVPDVLDNLLDSEFSQLIHSIVTKKSSRQVHDWDKLTTRYREKSEKFIEGLIKKFEKIIEVEDENGVPPGGPVPEGETRQEGRARGQVISEWVMTFFSSFRSGTSTRIKGKSKAEENGHDEVRRYLQKANSIVKKLKKK